jgi:hypothetical protein
VRLARLLFPLTERAFTYERYAALLDALSDQSRFVVVPLCEFDDAFDSRRAVVGLRHDVDQRLDRACDFSQLESDRGLRATYYVLNTARYWRRPDLVEAFLGIQAKGHEIGWHNDLVTLECVLGADARESLTQELRRLRAAGVSIEGTAAHGSPSCYRYGYHNGYFFFPTERADGFPNLEVVDGPLGPRPIPHGTLDEFDLRYDAYHLNNTSYFSDASFDARGARWHTDDLDLAALGPGTRTIILTHPDHWDATSAAKVGRLLSKVGEKVTR